MSLLTPDQRTTLEAPLLVPVAAEHAWGYLGVLAELVVYLTILVVALPWLYFCWRAARETVKRMYVSMFKEPW